MKTAVVFLLIAVVAVLGQTECSIGEFNGECYNTNEESCPFGKTSPEGCGFEENCCVQFFGGCNNDDGNAGECMDFHICEGFAEQGPCGSNLDLVCCVYNDTSGSSNGLLGQSINTAGLNLIKSFEGWEPCWYKDAAGYPTIGYGHLITSRDPYRKGDCITKSQGEALLKNDVKSAESCVGSNTKVSLSSNEFSALVSFTFNLGCGNYRSSTLLKKLNAGQKNEVCGELARWNKAGGKVLPGLTRRRKAECDLFSK
eukprot:TRINITY_DN2453_c0_g1_i1.p1 TRINITY_DN2453_c0_g1~~TRINITY_DN2453_c0_g1_i1.p1  ORF type:complete len:256 (-),score=60.45 TRINITY_DN2453_c0_g1_i1:37-804(-)